MFTQLNLLSQKGLEDALERDLRAWVELESADWDALVEGGPEGLPGGSDLWDTMPVLDSKAVARSSPVFEQHLGIKLDVRLIRAGGYFDVDDMISDLVPSMVQVALERQSRKEEP